MILFENFGNKWQNTDWSVVGEGVTIPTLEYRLYYSNLKGIGENTGRKAEVKEVCKFRKYWLIGTLKQFGVNPINPSTYIFQLLYYFLNITFIHLGQSLKMLIAPCCFLHISMGQYSFCQCLV